MGLGQRERNRSLGAAVIGIGLALWASSAWADGRAYGTTYQAATEEKGELEVENWLTGAGDGEVGDSAPGGGLREMLELEYGLTSRWDLALYNMLDLSKAEGGSRYAGLKVESRYRFSDPGAWPVDVVGYLEYQWRRAGDADQSLEAKAIVARDFGPWNVAGNLSVEVERLLEGGFNPEMEYALGVSRQLGGPAVTVGLETFGHLEHGAATEPYLFVGPAISFDFGHLGPLDELWLTLAGGKGLTTPSETPYARAIVGLEF